MIGVDTNESERPSKRQRIDEGSNASSTLAGPAAADVEVVAGDLEDASSQDDNDNDEILLAAEDNSEKELAAGISAYVSEDILGFSGVFKQRYTDFLVNEIVPSGETVHLSSIGIRNSSSKNGVRKKHEKSKTETPAEQPEANITRSEQQQVEATAVPRASENRQRDDSGQANEEDAEAIAMDISDADRQTLNDIFGVDLVTRIIALFQNILKHPNRQAGDFKQITTSAITDREARTAAHRSVRRIFHGKVETTTADDGVITLMAASPNTKYRERGGASKGRIKGRKGWDELGGEYCHFTLYKENKDTMEAVGFLASQARSHVKNFQFSGTKDRRAATVQRISAFRMTAEQLAKIGERLKNSRIGDFSYHATGLELGDLGGNEFCITLRDCTFPGQADKTPAERRVAAEAQLANDIAALRDHGFLNYYGLQRFGSFTRTTDSIGMKLLKGNLGAATADLLYFPPNTLSESTATTGSPIGHDDLARARAIDIWQSTQDAAAALDILPRKFAAETAIIRYMGQRDKRGELSRLSDFQGALQTIPRNLRLMYVHAYQSRVWNAMVSARWRRSGAKVQPGDLVLVEEHRDKEPPREVLPQVDELGEPIVRPAPEDSTKDASDAYERARALTAEEAASGKYTIFDVVLPLPGYDVEYPANWMEDEYKKFMNSEEGGGLDPRDMRRKWKDISLSGSYRKMIARPMPGMTAEVMAYTHADEQLVQTDLERLEAEQASDEFKKKTGGDAAMGDAEAKQRLAVILRMRLGSSTYATMALRELMRSSGVVNFRPDFGGGR